MVSTKSVISVHYIKLQLLLLVHKHIHQVTVKAFHLSSLPTFSIIMGLQGYLPT